MRQREEQFFRFAYSWLAARGGHVRESLSECKKRKKWRGILTQAGVEFQYVSPELCTSTCGPPSISHTRSRDRGFRPVWWVKRPTVERALINWHTHLSSGTHCTTAKRSQPDFESLASHVTSHGEQPEFARDTSPTRPCSGTSVRQLATKLACRLAWKRIETVVRARASCQR